MTDANLKPPTDNNASVLMVIEDLDALGGAEKQTFRLTKALQEQGLRVSIVTGCWNGRKPGSEVREGIPIHYISTASHLTTRRGGRRVSNYVILVSMFWFLWRYRNHYQILHFHEGKHFVIPGLFMQRFFAKKVIIKMRNSGEWSDFRLIERFYLPFERPFITTALRKANKVVSLNPEAADELSAEGYTTDQVAHMLNGIDVKAFSARETYTLGQPVKLLFLGRLDAQKGIYTLLQAISRLNRKDVEVIALGDGPERETLETEVEALGIKDRIHFLGRVSNVPNFLQQADIFVLPSFAEGISNALLEALSCGLPSIVADISGNQMVVTDQQDAWFFPPGDAEALAKGLDQLITDDALRQRLGQAARQTVLNRFSMDKVAKDYMALYTELI